MLAFCVAFGCAASARAFQQPIPLVAAVVHAANYLPGVICPREIFTLFGTNLGSSGATQVFFDGDEAFLLYVSETQINGIVPSATASRNTSLMTVVARGRHSNGVPLPVVTALPGLFTTDFAGQGQVAALNEDLTVNSAAHPALPGSVVIVYATGAGPLQQDLPDDAVPGSPIPALLPVAARIGAQPADVRYAGAAPGLSASVLQVNVVVPAGAGSGPAVPLQIIVNGITSQFGATIAIQ
jgi:uncharacterized protein (TIGR03437 family)